jgi:putative tributyrin esterase
MYRDQPAGFKLLFLLLVIFSSFTFAADQEIISIPSTSMKKNFKACVVTPKEYKSCESRFSAIYMLHGYSGDYSTWSRIAPLNLFSDTYHLIIVCPDGDFNSWYIDSPFKQESKIETYIVKEVVPYIDGHYRTWSTTDGRAIIGSSMGGHGATTVLAKYPDLFLGAGSISGIMDLTEFPTQWDMALVLGDYKKNIPLWRNSSFFMLVDKLQNRNKCLVLDCGVSDFACSGNRKTHEKLLKFGIPHEYYERPGSHTPSYAKENVEYHFLYFSKKLLKPGSK